MNVLDKMTLHELAITSRALAAESQRARAAGNPHTAADCRRLSRLFALRWAVDDSRGCGSPDMFSRGGEENLNEMLRLSDHDQA